MTRALRRPIVWLPVSLALLGFVAWRSRVWEASSTLGRVDPLPLIAAVALNVVVLLLWAARSSDLLRAAGWPVSLPALVPMTAFANTINNVTPGSVGELVRLYLLRAHHGVEYAVGGAVVVIERVVAIAYLIASALVLWAGHALGWPFVAQAGLLALIAAAPGILYGLGLRPMGLVAALPVARLVGEDRWGRWDAGLRRLDDTVGHILTAPAHAAVFALCCGGIFAVYATQLVLAGRAFGVSLDPLVAWGVLGLGIGAGVVSLLPFGLGSTDLVVIALLGATGVPLLEATAMTFAYRLVATLPLGLAGVASYAFLSASLPESGASGAAAAAQTGIDEGPPGS